MRERPRFENSLRARACHEMIDHSMAQGKRASSAVKTEELHQVEKDQPARLRLTFSELFRPSGEQG
jgi:hypothetical protein